MANNEYLKDLYVQNPVNNIDNMESVSKKDDEKIFIPPENISVKTERHGIIVKFCNMKLQRYEERIADLKDANRFIGEKIQINIGKIEKLNMKINNLMNQNTFLKSVIQAYPQSEKIINVLIKKNEKKINRIKTKKIPSKETKISRYQNAIAYNNKKIKRIELKVNTCTSIKEFFQSFSIKDSTLRNEKMMSCLRAMNESSRYDIQEKINKYRFKINQLSSSISTNRYMRYNLSSLSNEKAEGFLIKKEEALTSKMNTLQKKLDRASHKLERYEIINNGINHLNAQDKQTIQAVIDKNENIDNVLLSNIQKFDIPEMADAIMLSNSAIISDLNINLKNNTAQKQIASDSATYKEKTEKQSNYEFNEKSKNYKPEVTNNESKKDSSEKLKPETMSLLEKLHKNQKELSKVTSHEKDKGLDKTAEISL